jgi:hypothetical protein
MNLARAWWLLPYSKSLPGDRPREDFRIEKAGKGYGLGLEVVVVVVLDVGGVVVVVVVFVSFVFSVVGFTMVVLVSFFSVGEEVVVGATTSVRCSQAPRSAALAKMQSNFFIVWIGLPHLGTKAESNGGNASALPKLNFRRQLQEKR